MYLIIDEDYRLFKSEILSGKVRSMARRGKVSVVNLQNMKGMNCLKSLSENGLQGEFGENEWSEIQGWGEEFEF